jgi:small subunit ribosomal protein S1
VSSERAANRWSRQQLLDEWTEGKVRTSVVRNLVNFSAFVDLGSVDGLIHISELDWRHVEHPSDVLSMNDEVDIYMF